ncbi:hypothetical protein [Azospirillum sp. TSO35-2]|uniref:hypothetical protein n=1 Tax=Azospirillum sp. TSO35-2 TaxID=716796 RepID=UPI000D60C356|nr:hypothetical protein [Azospirillum sp. TSO35-2]PWC39657.1 hypothetical protein TSO352_05980 [Azospirillum sp. TSO35-2]
MLLPLHSNPFRPAPLIDGSGGPNTSHRPMRASDCVSAVLLFLAAAMLALLVLSANWQDLVSDARPPAYENTPMLVIPPHPR